MAVIIGVRTICWDFFCRSWVRLLMVRPKGTSISQRQRSMVGGAIRLQEVILGNGVCDHPYMFQCTWCIPFDNSGRPTRFFLGSSLAGYDWRPVLTGTWETALTYARFGLVDGYPLRHAGYDFDNSPTIEQRGEWGTRFGNCAETYPFLDLLMYVLCFF